MLELVSAAGKLMEVSLCRYSCGGESENVINWRVKAEKFKLIKLIINVHQVRMI